MRTDPTVKTLGLYLYQKFPEHQRDVFPTWDNIEKPSFDDLFLYIEKFQEAIKEKLPGTSIQTWKSPYLSELREFPSGGKIPTCIVLWYYWRIYRDNYLPELKNIEQDKKYDILSTNLEKTIEQLKSDPSIIPPEEDTKAAVSAEEFVNKLLDDHLKKKELRIELDIPEGEVGYVDDDTIRENKKNQIEEIDSNEEPFTNLFSHLPDFLGGDLNTTEELATFLRGCYRSLFDGEIGRRGSVIAEMMSNDQLTLTQLADKMTDNVNNLSEPISERWFIGQATKKFSKEFSKRVFNACLLPDFYENVEPEPKNPPRFQVITPTSYDFPCMIYGKRAGTYQIDHLISEGELEPQKDLPGHDNGQRIVNFAPLDTNQNRAASASTCNLKLMTGTGTAGYYDNMIQLPHPYCVWLINTHARKYQNHIHSDRPQPAPQTIPELNHVSRLTETSDINRERLKQLFEILQTKL